jgi:hypothetical protein
MLIELREGKSYRTWMYRLDQPLDADTKRIFEIARAIPTFQ